MGILNVTPDSFYDGGRYNTLDAAIKRAEELINEGADIIDIGGVSTRPGSTPPSLDEELKRVIPIILEIAKRFPNIIISIDTFRSEVAQKAIESGAHIINDISGGAYDEKILEIAALYQTPYVLMHIRGTPQNMQSLANYNNVIEEVVIEILQKLDKVKKCNICDVIIDPGFGFAKTPQQNWILLKNLEVFTWMGLPLLVGISRKSMIYKVINISPEDALYGTIFANVIAIFKKATIIRVHDPLPFKHIIRLLEFAFEHEVISQFRR